MFYVATARLAAMCFGTYKLAANPQQFGREISKQLGHRVRISADEGSVLALLMFVMVLSDLIPLLGANKQYFYWSSLARCAVFGVAMFALAHNAAVSGLALFELVAGLFVFVEVLGSSPPPPSAAPDAADDAPEDADDPAHL